MSLPSSIFPGDRCGWMPPTDCTCKRRARANQATPVEAPRSSPEPQTDRPAGKDTRPGFPPGALPGFLPPSRTERTELTVGEAIAPAHQAGEDAA